jgi:hypothetical protein
MDEDAAGVSGRDQQSMPSTCGTPFDTQDEPFTDVDRSDFELLKRVRPLKLLKMDQR